MSPPFCCLISFTLSSISVLYACGFTSLPDLAGKNKFLFGIYRLPHLIFSLDQTTSLNGLNLGEKLEAIEESLYLITGKESVYHKNPWLAQSVERNLEKGIQEGIYDGHTLRVLNGRSATDLRLHFYQKELYKIRWTFGRSDFSNLTLVFTDMKEYFIKRFGPATDSIFDDTFIWKVDNRRLQLSMDNESIQVEFRDEKIENEIKLA